MRLHIMPFHFFGGKFKNHHFAFESVGTQVIGYTLQSNISSNSHPLTRVQTDGFFYPRRKQGTVGCAMLFPDQTQQGCTYPIYQIESVLEAKWASIYFGMEMASRCNQEFIGIECDSLSIVRQIMMDDCDSKQYSRYYNHKIRELANERHWCGIRYIPSEINHVSKMLE
jgi:hypothetical protein